MLASVARLRLLLSRHSSCWMGLGARQSSVKFTALFRLGSACRATATQSLVLYGLHDPTMQHCPAISWSIVIIASQVASHIESRKTVRAGHERSILTSPPVRLR